MFLIKMLIFVKFQLTASSLVDDVCYPHHQHHHSCNGGPTTRGRHPTTQEGKVGLWLLPVMCERAMPYFRVFWIDFVPNK